MKKTVIALSGSVNLDTKTVMIAKHNKKKKPSKSKTKLKVVK